MMKDTSLLAYKTSSETREAQKERVFAAICNIMSDGAKGATDREIARYLGEFDLNRVRPRRNELVREGRIVGRFKKERRAAISNAKIRLSNLKVAELTQVLRGAGKPIK